MNISFPKDLVPDLTWLSKTQEPDTDLWIGPGPQLSNLPNWVTELSKHGHHTLVAATYIATLIHLQYWENWVHQALGIAMASLGESRPPTEQLSAVELWLQAPTFKHRDRAVHMVDDTKQLYWFHEEYRDIWFEEPGMWVAEASEFCIHTLKVENYGSRFTAEEMATTSLICSLNAPKNSVKSSWELPIQTMIEGLQSYCAA